MEEKYTRKLEDSKSKAGRGRMTDDVIDKMQRKYGRANRGQLPDVDTLSTASKAIL